MPQFLHGSRCTLPRARYWLVLVGSMLSACQAEVASRGALEAPALSGADASVPEVMEVGNEGDGAVSTQGPEPRDDAAPEPDLDAAPEPPDALDATSAWDAGSSPDAGAALNDRDAQQPDVAAPLDSGSTTGEDAQVSDASLPDAAQTSCSLSGSFAAEVVFDVQWKGVTLSGVIPVIAAGTGKIRVVVRLDADDSGGRAHSHLTACSGVLPDFAASWLIGELYGAHIPNTAWDQPTMPSWEMGWDFECRQPGCGLSSDQVAVTIGARAASADHWPGRKGSIEQIVPADHDADGAPGITLISRGENERNPAGKAYDQPPVTWTLEARATKLHLAFQILARVQAALTSCDAFSGSISDASVEARALGCMARRNDSPYNAAQFTCSKNQAEFVDENLPNWVVTGGTVRARRIAPKASCSAVRAVWE